MRSAPVLGADFDAVFELRLALPEPLLGSVLEERAVFLLAGLEGVDFLAVFRATVFLVGLEELRVPAFLAPEAAGVPPTVVERPEDRLVESPPRWRAVFSGMEQHYSEARVFDQIISCKAFAGRTLRHIAAAAARFVRWSRRTRESERSTLPPGALSNSLPADSRTTFRSALRSGRSIMRIPSSIPPRSRLK